MTSVKREYLGSHNQVDGREIKPDYRLNCEKNGKDNDNFVEKNLDVIIERYHGLEQRYKSLYENSTDLLLTIGLEDKILDCNRACLEILGYSRKEVVGKPLAFFVAQRNKSDISDILLVWKTACSITSRQIWLRRKSGREFPTLLSGTNLYDADGKTIGCIMSCRDMSEIYSTMQMLEKSKIKNAEDTGALSSRIAHDFKNPLSVIKNSIELMRMRTANMDSRTKNDFDRIERATVKISHQIEEVLEYVWPKPLNLSETSLFHILKLVTSKSNVQQVVIEIPKRDIAIFCDSAKMEVVFSNLILNSVQTMDGIGQIYVRAWEDNDCVTVEIEDTGHGIPAELIPKIFEPMFTTRQIGTGLGLVSCKTIVEKHGGSISVDTEINKGTKFTIRLPKVTPVKLQP